MHRAGIPSSSGADVRDGDEGGGHANPRGFSTVSEFFSLLSGHSKPVAARIKRNRFSTDVYFVFCLSVPIILVMYLSLSLFPLSLYIYIIWASDGKLISYTHIIYILYVQMGALKGLAVQIWEWPRRVLYIRLYNMYIHRERKREKNARLRRLCIPLAVAAAVVARGDDGRGVKVSVPWNQLWSHNKIK